jgi:hypothetical protein
VSATTRLRLEIVTLSYEDEWGWMTWADAVHVMLNEAGLTQKDWKSMSLAKVQTPNGPAYSLHFGAKITDEKLLEKLRTINGQEPFTYNRRPIFYCDNLKP